MQNGGGNWRSEVGGQRSEVGGRSAPSRAGKSGDVSPQSMVGGSPHPPAPLPPGEGGVGLSLMVLPTLIVGNELLILCGVGVAVGGWFLAHRHGRLRGFVDANRNGVDDWWRGQ